ncbi:Ribonuclease P protein subunit p40 [Tolypocladium paradoxum]|uniref:Ribonuclease P protein subunit p40 n=1 Tax=Tolypocladium paradoxum TaxID=94208 RepID=A0A2S4L991_9HYPO|nr:Ribonuclease P protein subunit p40 [Tolypocladium paradoxum]
MLSEGRETTDNTFTLHKGTLNMYLDKETFERAGLAGKPSGAKGNRGIKPRWGKIHIFLVEKPLVSYDLTSPSMVHGKRGFGRLLRACETVLDKPLEWIFCNAHTATPSPDPLEKHKPVKYTAEPTQLQNKEVAQVMLAMPSSILSNGDRPALEETATELYEWLSLIRLQSPRVAASDTIDPYLSRYTAPSSESGGHAQVCMLSWQGCIAASWLRDLVTDVLTACPPQQWFSISATGFSRTVPGNSNDLTLLRPSGVAGAWIKKDSSTLRTNVSLATETLVHDGIFNQLAQVRLPGRCVEVVSLGELFDAPAELGVDLAGDVLCLIHGANRKFHALWRRIYDVGNGGGGYRFDTVVGVVALDGREICGDGGKVTFGLNLFPRRQPFGAAVLGVDGQLLDEGLGCFQCLYNEEGRLVVFILEIDVDVELAYEGAQ